ncbi:MAG TPA: glutamate ABC transporter substrate-binding protein, partial [Lapillicoccus sp.]|nr:glutamate ABC transporter substrate-binding protein [Lapillicoccus sp.]
DRGVPMKPRFRATVTATLAGGLVVLLAACTTGTYTATPTSIPPVVTPTTTATSSTAIPDCGNPLQTYDPLPSLTSQAANNAVAEIRSRDYLIAGVSADSWLLGSRNPLTGKIEGFDIDLVHAVAQAIFGDPNKVQLVVISAAQRKTVLVEKKVDIVVRNMTMNCDRWASFAFSSQYYQSGLKILVRKGDPTTSLVGLAGKKVCAPTATSSLAAVIATPGVVPVTAANHTGCLVLFQNGEVDAIAGDDTVLAGLAAQDPYAFVPKMDPLTSEPYGIGIQKDKIDFVRYVNRVVDTYKADGRWQASYNQWFLTNLNVEATPPASTYGRT